MSMFFMIACIGDYDKKDHLWDDGITWMTDPQHMSKNEIDIFLSELSYAKAPNLNKAECQPVQEIRLYEHDGERQVILLVKAMGYGQATDLARDFCSKWYKPKQTSKKQAYTRKDLDNDKGRNARSGSYDLFFEQ